MQDAMLDICQQSATVLCQDRPISPTIRLILPMGSDLAPTKTNTSINLSHGNLALATVSRDGALLLAPGVTLTPDMTSPLGLSLQLVYQ